MPCELANHQVASSRNRARDSITPASITNVGHATISPLTICRGPGKKKKGLVWLFRLLIDSCWMSSGASELEHRPTDAHIPEMPFDFTGKVPHGHVVCP